MRGSALRAANVHYSEKKKEAEESNKAVDKTDADDGKEEVHDNETIGEQEAFRKGKMLGGQYREADAPIGVESRLTYSFVGENASVSSDESDGEETVELNIRPRFVFVASLCAVCLKKSRVVCECCQMVSYCSATHRARASIEHSRLCGALTEIRLSVASVLSEESEERERLDAEQYRVYRLELLGVFESKIGRPLDLWEKEIILYPRICRICRSLRRTPISCTHCAMESFCENHGKEHEKWCKEFQVLQRCLLLQQEHGCVKPRIPNMRQQIFIASPDIDFDRLMHQIYRNSLYYRQMDCYTYSTLSHLCTIPLTALYAMQISSPEWSSKTDYAIHILGAEFQFEGMNLGVWEKLFLHFLPNLKRLCLVLIGPELCLPSGVPARILSKVNLCSRCKFTDRAIDVLFQPGKLYHEFRREQPELPQPDLICLFNPGLYRKTGFAGEDSWLETIREFSKLPLPVAITSYTADEIRWEIARINSLSDLEILLEPRPNPFASIKPDRNFVSDDTNPLIYKNYYITVLIKPAGTLP